MNKTFLQNTKLKLRALEPEDLDLLYKWENDSALWTYGNTSSPYSRLVLREYINDTVNMDIFQKKQLRLMIDLKKENQSIGTVDIFDIDMKNNKAGVGILIDETYRKKNYGYETLMLLSEYSFNFLNLHQLYAHVAKNNIESLNLFKKAGYQVSGELKDWVNIYDKYENVYFMQKLR